MQQPSRKLAVPATAAVALLLVTTIMVLALHVLYSPASVHFMMWQLIVTAEALFAIHYAWLHRKLCSGKHSNRSPVDGNPKELGRQLIRHLQHAPDVKHCLRAWFVNSDHLTWGQDFKRGNFKELFAYALWYRTLDQMESDGLMHEVEDLILQLESTLGCKLPAGYNPELRFMSHLWDPIRHIYRPLGFYVVMEYLALVQHVALIAAGFKQQYWGNVNYYTYKLGPLQTASRTSFDSKVSNRDGELNEQEQQRSSPAASGHPSPNTDSMPIVFLHGVGAGLLPYLALIFNVATLGQPMILPESKHVSMRLVKQILSVDDMADTAAAILRAYGAQKAVVVGHSYGTFVASRMVLKYKDMVHSLCLLDPVCFAMFMPDLVKNFLYVRHRSGCFPLDIIMALVSSELHCRTALSRNFWWTGMNLWDDAIPERTLVALSGRDILSPTAYVHTWLTNHTHAKVLHKPHLAHAGVLVDLNYQQNIIEALNDMMNEDTSPSHASAAANVAEAAEKLAQDADRNQQQHSRPDSTAAGNADIFGSRSSAVSGHRIEGRHDASSADTASTLLSPDGVLVIDHLDDVLTEQHASKAEWQQHSKISNGQGQEVS